MKSTQWGELLGKLVVLCCWLSFRGLKLTAQLLARLTALCLPPATTPGAAATSAVLAGFGWTVLIGLVVTLLVGGSSAGLVVGFGLGAALGVPVGVAVFAKGKAQAGAAAGNIEVGERPGPLGVSQPHVIARAARVRHVSVFGATGSGKSTVLKNLVCQDAAAPGRPGLLCIDVKDDLVLDIAAHLPAARQQDVLLFDPSDTAFPPAFNPLAGVPPEGRTLAAAEMLSALKRLFADSWGPRLEHILRQVLLTLLETPEATLLDISRLLTDAAYRAWAVSQVGNFSVAQFWEREFPAIVGSRGSLANVESLLNKLGVLSYPEIRNVVGQTRRGLDVRQAMDEGKIILAHLPQGILGEDASHFLAALLVGKVQLAAQSRVALAHAQRHTFYVFADEFQNYETSAFDKLITEGRSLGVGLVAACQFREQLDQSLRLALERNCAYSLQCRYVQGKHTVQVIKLQELNTPDASTLVKPLPPPSLSVAGQVQTIRAQSRRILGLPRAQVEAEILTRQQPAMPVPAVVIGEPRQNGKQPHQVPPAAWSPFEDEP